MGRAAHILLRRAGAAVLLLAAGGAAALAQDPFAPATAGVRGVYRTVVDLLIACIGIGAMITLVMVTVRMMRGDRDAANRLARWLAVLSVGLVCMYVLKTVL